MTSKLQVHDFASHACTVLFYPPCRRYQQPHLGKPEAVEGPVHGRAQHAFAGLPWQRLELSK